MNFRYFVYDKAALKGFNAITENDRVDIAGHIQHRTQDYAHILDLLLMHKLVHGPYHQRRLKLFIIPGRTHQWEFDTGYFQSGHDLLGTFLKSTICCINFRSMFDQQRVSLRCFMMDIFSLTEDNFSQANQTLQVNSCGQYSNGFLGKC